MSPCRYGSTAPTRRKRNICAAWRSGKILGAFCLTEPQAGSDAAAIATRAERSANAYVLNGTKNWVTNGGQSGVYLIFAKTDPSAGASGSALRRFLVEPDFPGFRVARYEDKMGLRTSRSAELTLSDCQVPEANRLGDDGHGLKIALEALDGGRVGIAAQAVGIAQGALEASVAHAKQRRAFGKADCGVSSDSVDASGHANRNRSRARSRSIKRRSCATSRCHAEKAPREFGAFASRAKLYASEMVNRVVYKAVQIHGSMGYSRESDVERMYRDARVISIYEGTSEIQRMIIARDLLSTVAAHAGGR